MLDGLARRRSPAGSAGASVVGHTVVLPHPLRRLHPRHPVVTLPSPDRRHHAAARRGSAGSSTDAQPLIEERGLTLVGVAVANLSDADAVQLRAAVRRRQRRPPSTTRSTPCATASAAASVGRAALLGRDRGWSMPVLPYGE